MISNTISKFGPVYVQQVLHFLPHTLQHTSCCLPVFLLSNYLRLRFCPHNRVSSYGTKIMNQEVSYRMTSIVTLQDLWIGKYICWSFTELITVLQTLQMARARTSVFSVRYVFTCLPVTSNGGRSPYSQFLNCPRALATETLGWLTNGISTIVILSHRSLHYFVTGPAENTFTLLPFTGRLSSNGRCFPSGEQ
jgi:hypothetical protein